MIRVGDMTLNVRCSTRVVGFQVSFQSKHFQNKHFQYYSPFYIYNNNDDNKNNTIVNVDNNNINNNKY